MPSVCSFKEQCVNASLPSDFGSNRSRQTVHLTSQDPSKCSVDRTMSSWWNTASTNNGNSSWGWNSRWDHGSKNQEWTQADWQAHRHESKPQPEVPTPPPVKLPAAFRSDGDFLDKNAIGGHQLFKHIQSTPWTVKNDLAGRPIQDLRVVDLARKGIEEYSLRLISEGTYQGVVFTKSISEGVLVSHLLREIRQQSLNIDRIAASLHASNAVPDKHKESAKFMQPLIQSVVDQLRSLAPSVETEDSDELSRARAKLAAAGITLTPRKRSAGEAPDGSQPAKRVKGSGPTDWPPTPGHTILSKPAVRPVSVQPAGSTDTAVEEWLDQYKKQFKGKFAAFRKHVQNVQEVLKTHCSKADIQQVAQQYGLDSKLVMRMNIRNLTAVIGACQFEAA